MAVGSGRIGIPDDAHTNVLGSSTPSLATTADARAGDKKRRRDSSTSAGDGDKETDKDKDKDPEVANNAIAALTSVTSDIDTNPQGSGSLSPSLSLQKTAQIEKGRLRCLIELGQLDSVVDQTLGMSMSTSMSTSMSKIEGHLM